MNLHVPARLSDMRLNTIKACADGPKTYVQIKKYFEDHNYPMVRLSANIGNGCNANWFERVTNSGHQVKYKLTEKSKLVLKHLDEIEIYPYQYSGRPAKVPQTEQPAQQVVLADLDISKEANRMADSISEILKQNMEYRKALMSVRDLIDKLLTSNKGG